MASSILFVCTGNICRSPTANGILRALAPDLVVDSAATHAYHVGEAPDARSQQIAKDHAIIISDLRARKISTIDYRNFDLILGMDKNHVEFLNDIRPKNTTAKIALFLEYAGLGEREVPDPYYGFTHDFERCFDLIEQGCKALLRKLNR